MYCKKLVFMKTILLALIFVFVLSGCKKEDEVTLDEFYNAEIVGFDLNCSTCTLKFSDDNKIIKKAIGSSRNDYYQTVNLLKDTFQINQKVLVKIRKAEDTESPVCLTLFASPDYETIFVTEHKSVN